MGRPSNESRLQSIHHDALVEFDAIQSALRDERMQCLQDRRFYSIAGAQWEGPLGEQFENKPKLEVNKVHASVKRIFGEYRNNRIGVAFKSKDGAPDDKLADACAALYRADEQDSSAEEAYDNAFEEAVGGGFGAWRLRAKYEDEESEEDERQRVCIEPIFDADSSVFFDLNAKRQDKSDARACFVLTSMTRAEYERQYDEDPSSWDKIIHQHEFDWLTPDVVYLAEYYLVEESSDTVVFFRGLDESEVSHSQTELDEDEELGRYLAATGFSQVREKKIKRRRVHKYLLNGNRVLEDCGYIAGREIPIVPVYGMRWFIDNVERCMGHVRLAKDAQRIKNMQLSKLAEISALSAVEKPIVTPEQIAGHQTTWAEDNIKNYPYLLINPVMDAAGNQAINGPVGYTKPPSVPQALAALLELTEQDIRDLLGNPEQAEKMLSHVAGKTVELLQQRIDGKDFIYISNMAKAIRRSGQIWLSMGREVYTEPGRKMKGVSELGKLTQIELMKPMVGPDAQVTKANDMTRASFDVVADVGPSSASKRQAAHSAVTRMMAVTQDPETASVLSLLALMNMEGEGVEDVRAWSRQKLVRIGVIKPTDEEAQQLLAELQNKPTDPNALYLQAEAQKAQAQAQQALADVELTGARTEKTKAETVETLAGIDTARQQAAVDAAKSLSDMVSTQASLERELSAPAPGPGSE